ncbi:MAG: peptidase domain-containing ABC transporter [Alphaproteobacteria bacterium]|nr:peptidase domain-containing ABC transporter [Alphaproteobacteria bacterium]
MENSPSRAWLWPLLRPLKRTFQEVVAMSLFLNVLALAVPVFVLQVYDRVVFHQGLTTLQGLTIGVVLALLFDLVLRQARSRVLQKAALHIDVQLGRRLFDQVLALPLRLLEARSTAQWYSLFKDAEMVRATFSGSSAVLITDLPFVLLFIVVVFVIAEPIAWVLILALPCFVLLALRSGKVLHGATLAERESGQDRDAFVAEFLSGRATVKALALDAQVRPLWEDKHASSLERSLERGQQMDHYHNLGITFSYLTTIALTAVGALAIIDQQLTIGALIATNMLSNRVIGPLNQLVNNWRTYTGFRQAAVRLGQLFAHPGERGDSPVALARPQGRITLDNVAFAYDGGQGPVIDGVRAEIPPGSVVGVVGRNGSGKTTLIKLIQGLYAPSAGRVLLDGADISQFSRRQLARWIGYVPQECFLFNSTIRANIAATHPDASDEEIIKAAQLAGVHGYVLDLPEGYGTSIGEAGSRLSGGQRQRIAIARALVGDPPVLLLDEANGNLDFEAQQALRDTLQRLARDHTVVMVTHAPMLLAACQSVVVLEKGKVAMAGPAREVLQKIMVPADAQRRAPLAAAGAPPAPVPAPEDAGRAQGSGR